MMTIRLTSSPITEIRHQSGYTVTSGSPMEDVLPTGRYTVRHQAEAQYHVDDYIKRLKATGQAAQFLVVREKRAGHRAFRGFEAWQRSVRTIVNGETVTVQSAAA